MSEGLTALASENLNPSLRSLLEDVQKGHIRVPRFQRPFVWMDSQRLDLLRSIRDNMPIGSLLVWRTVKFKLASFGNVGPHNIPSIIDIAPATGWQYLLDGHQRVSTLLGLLLQPLQPSQISDNQDGESIDWDIQYNLLENDFVFRRKADRGRTKQPLLPLWTLLDGRLVNKHMRDLRKRAEHEGWTDQDLEDWEERADQLSYRFQQCRVPIVVMVSDDLELAARTFQRINSLGTPMGEAHLVAALTWRDDFDLRDQISQRRRDLPAGWRHIDEGLYLQVCKGLTGLDVTKAGQTELVKKLSDDASLLDRASNSIKQIIDWLANDIGVSHDDLQPYILQVVILASILDKLALTNIPKPQFELWLWRTSWSEVFATAAYRDVRFETEALENLVKNNINVSWTRESKLPDRFDFRSARVRLFTLRLANQKNLTDASGQIASGRKLLTEHGRDALVRIFTTPKGATPSLKKLIQGPGNRFLLAPETDAIFRERLKYGPDYSEDALAAHFIDYHSLQSLRSGDLESFLKHRATAMEQWDHDEWVSCVARAED
ncbi:GmrSD restriction endonuclease domain-containing protein [Pseudomonas sp. JAI120]|uniref:GmrSD restriction endonuclease domain-containing protein n=1 Tax=Pseudomonas sp. JAI120 TaxID=2723063 RepID=UPI0030DAAF4B